MEERMSSVKRVKENYRTRDFHPPKYTSSKKKPKEQKKNSEAKCRNTNNPEAKEVSINDLELHDVYPQGEGPSNHLN